MKPIMHRGIAACLLIFTFAAPIAGRAQGGPPPNGPGGPPPGMMAQFGAWNQWRMSHPHIEAVSRTLRGVEDMELGRPGRGGAPGTPPPASSQLNPAQARKMLAVLHAWQSKPVMTDAQASTVSKQLLSLLNPAQKAALASQRGPGGRGFGGPGRGPGPGGPGMGGPPPGGMMPPLPGGQGGFGQHRGGGTNGRPGGFSMGAPHNYNPLNPGTNPMTFMRSRAAQRYSAFIARLSATAK